MYLIEDFEKGGGLSDWVIWGMVVSKLDLPAVIRSQVKPAPVASEREQAITALHNYLELEPADEVITQRLAELESQD